MGKTRFQLPRLQTPLGRVQMTSNCTTPPSQAQASSPPDSWAPFSVWTRTITFPPNPGPPPPLPPPPGGSSGCIVLPTFLPSESFTALPGDPFSTVFLDPVSQFSFPPRRGLRPRRQIETFLATLPRLKHGLITSVLKTTVLRPVCALEPLGKLIKSQESSKVLGLSMLGATPALFVPLRPAMSP